MSFYLSNTVSLRAWKKHAARLASYSKKEKKRTIVTKVKKKEILPEL